MGRKEKGASSWDGQELKSGLMGEGMPEGGLDLSGKSSRESIPGEYPQLARAEGRGSEHKATELCVYF